MIKNIVFDISNVLAPFRLKEFLAEKGFDGDMAKQIYKASVFSPYWVEFERGKISEKEVIDSFVKCNPKIEEEIHLAFDSVKGIMGEYDYSVAWIEALKKAGYGVYCITNFTPAGYYQCYDQISFVEKMDGGIFSFQEGYVKPEPEIYKLLLERYKLNASECVFIDDTEDNVKGAEALGFKGIVFKSYDDAVQRLAAIGVEM